MARYYFDVHDSQGFHRDEDGDEFGSLKEAQDQAQALLPDIAREELPDGELHEITCEVRNDAGRIIYRARLTLRADVVDEPDLSHGRDDTASPADPEPPGGKPDGSVPFADSEAESREG